VGFHNALFVLDPDTGLWVSLPMEALVKHVAELHDGNEHCSRSSDYKAVAQHAISLADNSKFFAAAPVGIACPGGFYRLTEGGISVVAARSLRPCSAACGHDSPAHGDRAPHARC
jgi:hypothetical protein